MITIGNASMSEINKTRSSSGAVANNSASYLLIAFSGSKNVPIVTSISN
jgi:hypothetical protein